MENWEKKWNGEWTWVCGEGQNYENKKNVFKYTTENGTIFLKEILPLPKKDCINDKCWKVSTLGFINEKQLKKELKEYEMDECDIINTHPDRDMFVAEDYYKNFEEVVRVNFSKKKVSS